LNHLTLPFCIACLLRECRNTQLVSLRAA